MLREKTINRIKTVLTFCKENNVSINKACTALKVNNRNFYPQLKSLIQEAQQGASELQEIVDLYYYVTASKDITLENIEIEEEIDNNQQSEVSNIRNEKGKIVYYKYKIYKKNKPALQGRLTCEEMNTIYRLYTYYGDNLTARVVSRHFPDFSLPDFKRIIRAFNLYKDSGPFAPHMYENYTEEELRDIQLREKENSFLRKAEEDNIKNNEKLLRKYANENIELKKQLIDKKELIQE